MPSFRGSFPPRVEPASLKRPLQWQVGSLPLESLGKTSNKHYQSINSHFKDGCHVTFNTYFLFFYFF